MDVGLFIVFSVGLVGVSASLDVSSSPLSFGVLLLSVVSSFRSFEVSDEFLFDVPDSTFVYDSPTFGFSVPSFIIDSLVLLVSWVGVFAS